MKNAPVTDYLCHVCGNPAHPVFDDDGAYICGDCSDSIVEEEEVRLWMTENER